MAGYGLCGECYGGVLPEERHEVKCPHRECPKCGETDPGELITINVAGTDKTECKSCIRARL